MSIRLLPFRTGRFKIPGMGGLGRRTVWLGLAALLFFISVGVSVTVGALQYRHQMRLERNGMWMTSQASLEAARFSAALSQYLVGQAPAWAVSERFEIFYSRIRLLESVPNEHGGAAVDMLERSLPELMLRLDALDADLTAVLGGDSSMAQRLLRDFNELDGRLNELTRALHRQAQHALDRSANWLSGPYWLLLGSLLGLLLSTGLLVWLIVVEGRQARANLVKAEAAAESQAEAERMLRTLIGGVPAMIGAFDRDGRFLFLNDALARFHGIREEDAIGRSLAELGLELGGRDLLDWALGSTGPTPQTERRVRNREGSIRTLLITAVAVSGEEGRRGRVVMAALDITERKEAEDRIRHLAEHDPMTDLPNRLLFSARLRARLRQAQAGQGGDFALHLIDLDGFKAVNDGLGHTTGDKLLLAAVERMRGCLRADDLIARMGGDEFAVIQAEARHPAEARRLAERLVRIMAEPFEVDGCQIRSGASIGSALGLRDGQTLELLQQRADMALYRAKADGRSRSVLFDPAMEELRRNQRMLEEDLREALERDQLTLVYQPKFGLLADRMTGCEALLRWHHPIHGAMNPGRFVPAAEEAGMAATLTRNVLGMVCRQIRDWQARGLEVPVAVNISASLFATDQAVQLVREALMVSGVPPRLLQVELTEQVFIRSADAARAALHSLHELGVSVALDDFGTGYSSLGYLQHLDFDVLKIDQGFIQNLGIRDDGAQGNGARGNSLWIVETILRLAHGLGAEVVAEGVETPEQLHLLREIGCDAAQGYLLGRPMPAEAFATLFTAPVGGAVPHAEGRAQDAQPARP
ncbi:putative bifunctional diguanylate cyclase/phosphodiesterase [Pseudoroseomonas globiformis]|uniref:Bifunctional diguanylate cyclase/phosphodiesterase n=1 Tax=Teichococcus globiformis TaxID=2307229 RepID=A0ABV7FUT8_9PROT